MNDLAPIAAAVETRKLRCDPITLEIVRGALRATQSEMEAAHRIISAKLPKRTRDVLAMPVRERKRVIAGRKAVLVGGAPKSGSLR